MRVTTDRHIAEIEHWEYFSPVFENPQEAKQFVENIEKIDNRAKVILHQSARMLFLADKVYQKSRPGLDILFFIILAEAVAKIAFNFEGEGESKKYIYKFFGEICDDEEKNILKNSFVKESYVSYQDREEFLSWEEVIELLYRVRCDIVHRGIYFDNIFLKNSPDDNDIIFQWKESQSISPRISIDDLRKIILKGTIKACRMFLVKPVPS